MIEDIGQYYQKYNQGAIRSQLSRNDAYYSGNLPFIITFHISEGRVRYFMPTSRGVWINHQGLEEDVPGVMVGHLSELEANRNRVYANLRIPVEQSFLGKNIR